MEANELMIGDWVEFPEGVIRQIRSIDKINGKNTIINQSIDNDFLLNKDVNPIPVTPKILLNNGFHNKENAVTYKYESEPYKVSVYYGISSTEGRNWSMLLINPEIDCVYKSDFEFVHELQHALMLCGIYKEIVI